MRERLRQIGSQERHTYRGTFVRCGYKCYGEHYHPTLLLKDIRDATHQIVTDHLWFNYTLGFLRLGELLKGDEVNFMARVATYEKGLWMQRQQDVHLCRPTRVQRVVPNVERASLPLDDHPALIGYIMCANETFYKTNGRPFVSFYVQAFHQWQRQKSVEQV